MQLEQYTTQSICESMGIPAFIEAAWTTPTLRVLLKPSFHPEVCVTVGRGVDATHISVVTLTHMLWQQPFPCRLPTRREQTEVTAEIFTTLEGALIAAHEVRQRDGVRMVVLTDGIGAELGLKTSDDVIQFAEQICRAEVRHLVAEVVRIAWEALPVGYARNALACCGDYVGLSLPHAKLPEEVAPLRLAVMGEPEAREDYFRQLSAHEDRKGG